MTSLARAGWVARRVRQSVFQWRADGICEEMCWLSLRLSKRLASFRCNYLKRRAFTSGTPRWRRWPCVAVEVQRVRIYLDHSAFAIRGADLRSFAAKNWRTV